MTVLQGSQPGSQASATLSIPQVPATVPGATQPVPPGQGQSPRAELPPYRASPQGSGVLSKQTPFNIQPEANADDRADVSAIAPPNQPQTPRPRNGSQLFQQRWAALQAGQIYTRISPGSFAEQWQAASTQPTHEQWQALLAQEARAIQAGQGQNALTIVLGDSLSLWLPPESLPRDRFWLNQGISGDTTAGILRRLHYFEGTRPTTIHLMAGINDLKQGASDADVFINLTRIVERLKQQHPYAEIVVHSMLPTRLPHLPSHRIHRINRSIARLAQQQGVTFLDLQPMFADATGNLKPELTSDGLHLNRQGYHLWQLEILQI